MLKLSPVYKLSIFLLLIFSCSFLSAQTNVLGGWNILNYNYSFNKKVFLYSEAQLRSQRLANDFYYHELKFGGGYNITGGSSVFAGIGNYETYTFPGNLKKPLTSNEFRIWEQFVISAYIDRIKFENRFRIEQRWINGDFFNRFRYRINPIIPLNHSALTANTVYIPLYNEVFFTNKTPYFIRNRVFAGIGYQFTKSIALQGGFIRQFDYRKADDGSGKNFMQMMLIINGGHPGKEPQHSNTD